MTEKEVPEVKAILNIKPGIYRREFTMYSEKVLSGDQQLGSLSPLDRVKSIILGFEYAQQSLRGLWEWRMDGSILKISDYGGTMKIRDAEIEIDAVAGTRILALKELLAKGETTPEKAPGIEITVGDSPYYLKRQKGSFILD